MLDEEDGDELLLAVVAGIGAVSAAVGEGFAIGGEAEAVVRIGLAGLIAGHGLHGFLGENASAFEYAIVCQHLVEEGEILGGGEEATSGHGLALGVVQWVEELADGDLFEVILRSGGLVGFREARLLLFAGPEGGVAHAEGLEEALCEELFIGHAADDFDDAACGVDAGIGVLGFAAGLEEQGHLGITAHALGEGLQIERGGFHLGLEVEAAGVAEDLAHEDGMARGDELGLGGIGADIDLLAFELGEVFFYRIVHIDLAFIDEDHEACGGDGLRLRGDPEDGVGAHGLLRGDVHGAHGFDIEDLVGICDENDGTGERVAFDEGPEEWREFGGGCFAAQRGGEEEGEEEAREHEGRVNKVGLGRWREWLGAEVGVNAVSTEN